jgi:hypothetical protein
VKVSVRLIGAAFARADTLVNEIRRRAIECLAVRIAAGTRDAQPTAEESGTEPSKTNRRR